MHAPAWLERTPGLVKGGKKRKSQPLLEGKCRRTWRLQGGTAFPLPYYEAAYFDVGGAGGREARENPEGARGLRLPEKYFL